MGGCGGWGRRGESDDLDEQQISLLVKLIQSLNSHQLKYQRQQMPSLSDNIHYDDQFIYLYFV